MPTRSEVIWQNEDARIFFARHGLEKFADFMAFADGTRICHKRGRSVVRMEVGGRAFYLKRNHLHRVEFWKSLSRGRWPKLGARTEWENILALRECGIPTVDPVAMGERIRFGTETASFTLTEEIYHAEPLNVLLLRDYVGPKSKDRIQGFRQLIRRIAALARQLHGAGMNHQDFYLNHFFAKEDGSLYLLDLQRLQRRRTVSRRYLVKDLAQLHYSADFYGIGTRADRMRFFLAYLEVSALSAKEKRLVRLIIEKVRRIAKHDVKLLVHRRKRGELP